MGSYWNERYSNTILIKIGFFNFFRVSLFYKKNYSISRYVMPTQVFFETLINEWNQIKAESENEEVFYNFLLFTKKVKKI